MKYEKLLNSIGKDCDLNQLEIDKLKSYFVHCEVPKRTVLQNENEISNYVYFINKGILRLYSIDSTGKQHTLNFAIENYWVCDFYSFLSEKPAYLIIETLADSDILIISRENRNRLFEEIPKLNKFFRVLLENSVASIQQKILDDKKDNAKTRYNNFCKKFPTLVNRIQDKHIASYISVTPEFFSKMMSTKYNDIK